jgi:prevent-host-death family protein
VNTVSIHEAKANLSALIEQVRLRGESVFLCRYGKPVAEIAPLRHQRRTKVRPDLAATLKGDPTAPTVEEWEDA